jgi:hypothetical protein
LPADDDVTVEALLRLQRDCLGVGRERGKGKGKGKEGKRESKARKAQGSSEDGYCKCREVQEQ